jgi:enoyl-CoA hydratase/carnithine racemase
MSEHVIVTREGPRLKLLLNRPERRNAITVAMYAALADAIEGAANDETLRLITLEGAGQDFTAGNELTDFLSAPLDRSESGDDTPVWRVLRGLARNTVPIIAAVHGNAVGIGTTMLFHCDLIVAEEGTRFVMPFVDLGLVPEAASSLLFPRIAGRRAAARHLLLGEPFGVDEAERFGLVSHRAPAGGLDAALDRLVTSLLAKPAQALKLTQKLLRGDDQQAVLERMDLENGHFGERLTSDEVKTAIANFFAARANR